MEHGFRHRVLFQCDGFTRQLADRIREDEDGRDIDIDKPRATFYAIAATLKNCM